MNKQDKQVTEYLQSIGVKYSASYVAEVPKDWGDGKTNAMDQWLTTLKKGKAVMQEMYFTGLGHRKATEIDKARPEAKFPKNSIGYADWAKRYVKPVKPSAASVLHSLLMDAEAIHENFNDWCFNFGYDSDSMKTFKIYQDCCEIGKKLCQVFTLEEQNKLRKLLQDY